MQLKKKKEDICLMRREHLSKTVLIERRAQAQSWKCKRVTAGPVRSVLHVVPKCEVSVLCACMQTVLFREQGEVTCKLQSIKVWVEQCSGEQF